MPSPIIPIVGGLFSFLSSMQQAQGAQQAAAAQSAILDTMRQLINRYMGLGQLYDPVMAGLATGAIESLTPGSAAYQARLGEALENVDVAARQALANLIGQGGPDLEARLPQIARALAEQVISERANIARSFAAQQADDLTRAFEIAQQMSGRSLLPGAMSALGYMGEQYGRAASGAPDPFLAFGNLLSAVMGATTGKKKDEESLLVPGLTAPLYPRFS